MRVLPTAFCNTADLTNILHAHVSKKQRELQNSKKSEEGIRSPTAQLMQAVEKEAAKTFVK